MRILSVFHYERKTLTFLFARKNGYCVFLPSRHFFDGFDLHRWMSNFDKYLFYFGYQRFFKKCGLGFQVKAVLYEK